MRKKKDNRVQPQPVDPPVIDWQPENIDWDDITICALCGRAECICTIYDCPCEIPATECEWPSEKCPCPKCGNLIKVCKCKNKNKTKE